MGVFFMLVVVAASSCDQSPATPPTGGQAVAPVAADWKTFVSKRGRFSIRLPAEPTASVEPAGVSDGDAGRSGGNLFRAAVGDIVYGVAYTDYPAGLVDADKVESMLAGARDGAARQVGGKVVKDELTNLDGQPGRAVTIESKTGDAAARIDCRFYLVGSRLYQLTVARPGATAIDDEVAAFLDSFRLISD